MPARHIKIATAGPVGSTETIDHSWFGAVQTGFHDFAGFEQSAEVLNLGLVRWPGGTLSETRPEVYGLDHPGLFDATELWRSDPRRERPDLEDSMEYSIENGMDFSMIVPTGRYANDIDLGETHLRGFLDDLFTGRYGELPGNFTLELGNEYHDLPEFENNPGAYGGVASRFAEIIAERMDMHLSDAEQSNINIAVQMGIDADDNTAILNAFSPEALTATNALVFHSLPISLRNLNRTADDGMTRYERADSFADDWRTAILDAGGDVDPDLFMSAWTVGSSTHNPDNLDLEWHEFGSRAAMVVLDTFAGYSSIGVDSAAIWGVDVANLNSVTTTEDGTLELSHSGEMFRMMADSLVGKTFVGDFTPSTRGDPVIVHTYTDGTELTNYIAINELTEFNEQVLLDFDGANNIRLVHAEMLTTELDPDFDGDIRDLDARLHEIPRTYEMEDIFTEEGLLIDFTHQYDVAEVEVIIGDGTTGTGGDDWIRGNLLNDHIEGFGGDDYLIGGGGFDHLIGGRGDDVTSGGAGNDWLFGNAGDDTLIGGDGRDVLGGGTGFDRYIGGEGRDWFQMSYGTDGGVIRDFEVGTDAVDMSDVFARASSVAVTGPDYFDMAQDLGPGGDGTTWALDLTQQGEDTLLRVFDDQGAEQMTLTFRGIAVDDLTRDFFSNFQLGRDEDLTRLVTGSGGAAPVAEAGTIPDAPGTPAERDAGAVPETTEPPPEPPGPFPTHSSWLDRLKTAFVDDGGRPAGAANEAVDPTAPDPDYIFESSDWGIVTPNAAFHGITDSDDPMGGLDWTAGIEDPPGNDLAGMELASALI